MNYMNYAAKKMGTSDKMSKGREQIEQENVVIRTFREEDIPQIVDLFNTVFGSQGAMLRTIEVFKWRYLNCDDFDKNGILVAEAGGKIVSSAIITFKDIKIHEQNFFIGAIDDVMTHPNWRKKGLAKSILQRLIDYGKQKNVDGILLYTGVNGVAYKFYRKLGFEDINHYTALVRVTNLKKIFKVGDVKAKLFSLGLTIMKLWKREPKIYDMHNFELIEITSESDLKEALNLFNEYNKQFVGFKEVSWDRWLWILKTVDIAETHVFGVRRKEDTRNHKEFDAIAIITKHKGTFINHILSYGILKIAYRERKSLSVLLKNLNNISKQFNLDFFMFSLPILEKEMEIEDILKAYNFIDFGKLTGSLGCLMMLFFNKTLKQAVENNKQKPWYIFLEHKLGRP